MGSVSNVRRKVTWPGTVLMLPHRVSLMMPKEIMFYINYFRNCSNDVSLIVKYINS